MMTFEGNNFVSTGFCTSKYELNSLTYQKSGLPELVGAHIGVVDVVDFRRRFGRPPLDQLLETNAIKDNSIEKKEEKPPMKIKESFAIIDHISSIEVHSNRVLLVRFDDGTFTKADCGKDNPFDFDMLFTIAVMKRLLDPVKGSNLYHKLVRKGRKIFNLQEEKKEKLAQMREQERLKREKIRKKKGEKAEKAAEKQKALIRDAFVEALDICDSNEEEEEL